MNGRISSIAAGPHSNDHIRRARVNGTLKPGFLIRKEAGQKQLIIASSHLADPIAASTSDEAPMSDQLEAKQGAAAKDADDPSQTKEKVEELPKPVPGFEVAQAPKLIAVDTTSISLQWQSVAQLPADEAAQAYSRSLGDDVGLPNCDVEYCLQTRQMGPRESKADLSIPNVTWQNCYRGKDTFTQVRNLRPGRRYAYRIVIKPDVVPPWADPPEQPPSAAEIYETPATVPMPPKPIKCTRRERAAFELRWFEPGETGGRPIQEYTAQMRPPPADAAGQHPNLEGFVEIYRGRENRHRQKNLAHATEYEFRLKARNEVGESAWSDVVAYMTKATVPGDPQAPALISAGATALQLHWPQPSDGGSAITHYVLQWDTGDGGPLEHELKTPMPLAEVNDLRSGRTYRFRVQAFNEVGHSQPSTITDLRTGCTVPACPGPPRVTGATKSTVTLAWKAPEETGGSQVLDYEAEVQPKSRAAMDGGMADEWMLVYQGDRAICTIQCLRAGCTYRVRARARNASGYSSYSGASDAQTAPDRPLAPEPPVAAARSASSISVTWAPPQHDGGSAISAYRLELCRDAPQIAVSAAKLAQLQYEMVPLENSGVDCRADIPDLEPGLDYLLRVSAVNAQGPSPASEPACISTKASPPVAPEPPYVAVPAAANSLQLEWPEPWGCGAPVSGYAVEMAPADAVLTVQGPPTPPQEGAGDALASSLTAIAEPLQQLAPSIASSMDAEDSASMCASAAGEPGSAGAPEQHRPQPARARRRAGSKRKGPWVSVYTGPERSCRVDGLDPFTEYGFKVRATNAAGHSDWSSMSCLRTASGPPTAPSNLHADGSSSTSILTCWDMPTNDYGSAITAYHVEVSIAPPRQKSAPSWQRAYSGIATTCEVEGLRPGKSYLFRVRASNAKGQGPWSSTSGAETQPAPPEPPGAPVISQRASTSARCKWDVPVEDHGAAVLRYRLEVSEEGREWQEAWRGLGTSARIGGLRPGRAHQARVVASNAVGEGAFSRTAAFTTLLLAPPAPAQLQAESLEEPLSLVVRWVLPEADDSHAEAACHEIEAISLPDVGLGHSSRGKASGRAQQHELADVQPGLTYEVKVRSVGASGAGHSPWSEPVAVTMPGRAEAPPPRPASTASEASEAPKRRRKKGGHERELEQADPKRKVAQKKVARKPKEHTFFLLRFWRAHRMKCVLGLVVTAMLLLFVSGISMGNIEKSARQMAKEMEAERREASAEQAKRRAEENERIQRNRQFKAQGQARLEELIRDAKMGKKIKQGGKERRFGSDPFDFVPPGVTPQDFMFGDGPLLGPTRG